MSSRQAGATVPPELVELIAEASGIGNLPQNAAKYLAEDITFQIKSILLDVKKFVVHSKRREVLVEDLCNALRMRQICTDILPPLDAIDSALQPFAVGTQKQPLFVAEETEISVDSLIDGVAQSGQASGAAALPPVPNALSLHAHWLAVDGVQPAIPENPSVVCIEREQQTDRGVDASRARSAIEKDSLNADEGDQKGRIEPVSKRLRLSNDTVRVRPIATHEIAVEQQIYFRSITEAIVGSAENERGEALSAVQTDPGLHQLVPRLVTFIAEGVKVNVLEGNLALLIYLVRLAKALLDNPHVRGQLEYYAHELVPALLTCILSKQLCQRPDIDNHWALRDFSAKQLSVLVRSYSNASNQLLARVTRLLANALEQADAPFTTRYGAVAALTELGSETVQRVLVPHSPTESERIRVVMETHIPPTPLPSAQQQAAPLKEQRVAAEHLRNLLVRVLASHVRYASATPSRLDEARIRDEFGAYLGSLVLAQVRTNASQTANAAAVASTPTMPRSDSNLARQPAPTSSALPQTPLAAAKR